MSSVKPQERIAIEPGLYPGLTRAEYDAIDAINVSTLVHFERSAAHALAVMQERDEPTKDMEMGTAFHCAVLEPERFAASYITEPSGDGRTKAVKAERARLQADYPNATMIDGDDYATILKMREAVWSHTEATEMIGGAGHNEVGVVWLHEETGLLCKSLIDRIGTYKGWTYVIDLKSSRDASKREFRKQIRNLHYGARAAFYIDGCNTVAPRSRRFAWVAVEKTRPYAVAVYEADESAIEAGRHKYSRWLWLYAEALRTGNWKGYDGFTSFSAEDTEFGGAW